MYSMAYTAGKRQCLKKKSLGLVPIPPLHGIGSAYSILPILINIDTLKKCVEHWTGVDDICASSRLSLYRPQGVRSRSACYTDAKTTSGQQECSFKSVDDQTGADADANIGLYRLLT